MASGIAGCVWLSVSASVSLDWRLPDAVPDLSPFRNLEREVADVLGL
jgi:hypothetical protein